MRKKILLGVLVILLLASAFLAHRLPTMLLAANGYAAKWACSNMHVGDRTLEQAIGDLPSSLLATWLGIQDDGPQVTSTFFGRFARSAVYRDDFGCTLVPPGTETSSLEAVPHGVPSPPRAFTWPDAPPSFDGRALESALAEAFREDQPAKPKNTRATLVLFDGHLVAERYAEGFDAGTRLPGWSMTKSVLNALYGRAALLGHLKMDSPPQSLGWRDGRSKIQLDHLMRMSSGLNFSENYADLSSDAVRMLFVSADSGLFAAKKTARAAPDEVWYYSSGTSNLLSRELRDILGLETYLRFPQDELFEPLGMTSALIEPDASGTFVASSFGWATARDWARFGELYLEDGFIEGRRLLPEGWVEYTTRPTSAAPQGLYGAHFWLNAGSAGNPEDRRWPELPSDLYLASGFQGQAVVIVPSRRAVIVRLGLSRSESSWSLPDFLRDVLEALPTSTFEEVGNGAEATALGSSALDPSGVE